MNAWQLALIVTVIAMFIGYAFYDEPKPVPESIAVDSAPPDRVIIEAP